MTCCVFAAPSMYSTSVRRSISCRRMSLPTIPEMPEDLPAEFVGLSEMDSDSFDMEHTDFEFDERERDAETDMGMEDHEQVEKLALLALENCTRTPRLAYRKKIRSSGSLSLSESEKETSDCDVCSSSSVPKSAIHNSLDVAGSALDDPSTVPCCFEQIINWQVDCFPEDPFDSFAKNFISANYIEVTSKAC